MKAELDVIRAKMKAEPDFAWGWHCNIACCVMDAGASHSVADDAAGRFMRLAFGVSPEEYTPKSGG